ncbi:MAG: M48 family metallopeptidase [Alphaproteobacteria bacterium]
MKLPSNAKEMESVLNAGFKADLKIEDLSCKSITDFVHECAKSLGKPPPQIYIADKFPAMLGGKLPNALSIPMGGKSDAIIINREMLQLLGHQENAQTLPAELKFVIGHEMGHLKQGRNYITSIRSYPPLVGLIGGLAAVYLLDLAVEKAQKKQKKEAVSDKVITQALGETAEEERKKYKDLLEKAADSHKVGGTVGALHDTVNAAIKAGEYIAAAAVGGITGLHTTRHLVNNLEYDADRMGAKLCGDPKAGIRFIQKHESHIRSLPRAELIQKSGKYTAADVLKAYFFHSHPTNAERIKALEKMALDVEKHGIDAIKLISSTAQHVHI